MVFLSDHGYHLGDHGGLWMKQSLFERATRTPVMIAGPGVSAQRGVSRRIVELVDLYPTLAELTGLSAPAALEGRSLVPLLSDPRAEWDHAALSQARRPLTAVARPAGAVADSPGVGPAVGYSLRTERWRYMEWDDGRLGQEFYDAFSDPGELRNLASDPAHASDVAAMKARLATVRGPSRMP